MKKTTILIIAFIYPLLNPNYAQSDYVMMCTFFQNPEARVYKLSEEGDISFDYKLDVGGYPLSIKFSPNGHWGLVGGDTTVGHPERQKTVVLGIDKNRKISVLGSVHNEHECLVAISPDSRYGVHGADLKTIRFLPDNSFYAIPTDNPILCVQAKFSNLSNNILGQSKCVMEEYYLMENGRTKATSFTLDISPATGYCDLEITPDGKTCIALSNIRNYEITSLRIHEQGGFSLVQQFGTDSLDAAEVDFTPDSRFAVVAFTGRENLRSYSIDGESKLSQVDELYLPGGPGEDMAITPDGKYVVTRELINYYSFFYVVRLHEDGTMEYLPEKDYVCGGHVSAMAFVPPRITSAEGVWNMYE